MNDQRQHTSNQKVASTPRYPFTKRGRHEAPRFTINHRKIGRHERGVMITPLGRIRVGDLVPYASYDPRPPP